MVDGGRLVVNDGQIRVDGIFLNFQVIAIGNGGNYGINVFLIRLRKRQFGGGIFNVANRISGMDARHVIHIYNITVMDAHKRITEHALKVFERFEGCNHFA